MRHSDTFLLVAFALGHFFALCTAQDVTSLLPELGFSLPDFPFDFLFDERQVCWSVASFAKIVQKPSGRASASICCALDDKCCYKNNCLMVRGLLWMCRMCLFWEISTCLPKERTRRARRSLWMSREFAIPPTASPFRDLYEAQRVMFPCCISQACWGWGHQREGQTRWEKHPCRGALRSPKLFYFSHKLLLSCLHNLL